MTTPLDITDFVYNTGTLTIAPGDTIAVFSGTGLSANIKAGDTLCAGGVKVPVKTVTDDTHAELFTAWDGTSVTGGTYVILKDSMLRDNAVQIGYDTAAFLSFLDNTTIWYVVEGAAPDPSVGEDSNRALKTNVTPWQQWLKTGGVWVLQAGSPGGPGATILVQDAEPDTSHPDNSLWIDSDSADLDVYALTGSPPAWTDTGMNLKGATGPAALKPIEAWATGVSYVVGPPASFVSQAGSAYECLDPHTSGTFATDLAAGKWGLVAAKGADGTGVGDVVGPASATDAHIVLFDTTSGKAIKDSGKAVSDFATAEQGAKADSAVQDVAAVTHAATSKATPVDADEFALVDSAASNVLKKLTWANLKAGLAAFVGDSGTGGVKGLVPAPASGDAAAGKFLKASGGWAVPAGGGGGNSGRLSYTSTTALTFAPYNGDTIKINGSIYQIPASGIAGLGNPTSVYLNGTAAQTLAINTTYYIYVFNNSGTLTADFSTTGHSPSATSGNVGTEIKTGDDTRSLIGMVRTGGTVVYASDILTASWFNRKGKVSAVSSTLSAAGTSAVNPFLCWGDETTSVGVNGQLALTGAPGTPIASNYIDGSAVGTSGGTTISVSGYASTVNTMTPGVYSEGYHEYTYRLSATVNTPSSSVVMYVGIRG